MSDRAAFEQKVLHTIRQYNMILPDDSVLVGLSGGADSVSLLLVLLRLREQLHLQTIAAIHLNHGLRGEEADRDERYVTELCKRLNVPLAVHHADVRALAAEKKVGLEEAGRDERYRLFAEDARRFSCRIVATAHTLSDNAETILMHMIRGSGLTGLRGIPPVRGNFIRPLIGCLRQEIEEYCTENQVSFVTDSTNFEDTYFRNAVRLQVLPLMRQHNPRIEEALERLSRVSARDEEALQKYAEEAFKEALLPGEGVRLRLSVMRSLDEAISARVWKRTLDLLNAPTLEESHIGRLTQALATGGTIDLPGRIRVRFREKTDTIYFLPPEPGTDRSESILDLKHGCEFCTKNLVSSLVSLSFYEKNQIVNKNLLINSLDYDSIRGKIRVRSRLPGDSFRPCARNVSKSLKKLFNEAGIVPELRDSVPVLCDDDGIIMVLGFGCDERVRVRPDSQRVLWIWEEADHENIPATRKDLKNNEHE